MKDVERFYLDKRYTRFFHDGTQEPIIVLLDRGDLLCESGEDFVDTVDAALKERGFYDDSDLSSGTVCFYMAGWPSAASNSGH